MGNPPLEDLYYSSDPTKADLYYPTSLRIPALFDSRLYKHLQTGYPYLQQPFSYSILHPCYSGHSSQRAKAQAKAEAKAKEEK